MSLLTFNLIAYLPGDISTKVDRSAMGVSLEARVLFFDHRLVEFALSLPSEFKLYRRYGHSVAKWVLGQVFYRHLPQALIERTKAGCDLQLEHRLRGRLRGCSEDMLCESRIKCDGFLIHEPVRQ